MAKSTAMIAADTESGNINFQNCHVPSLGVKTQSGNIDISDCAVKELNSTLITSGSMSLQLVDHVDNYRMDIQTKTETQIVINGKNYSGGEFILNENASNNIHFDSYGNGSLVITENPNK